MDVHEKFIRGGEIIYSPKTDSIAFIAGKDRILFRFWLYNSPNVKSVNLYWDNNMDSLIVPVTPTTGLDSADIILPDMAEKSYTFNVRTVDKYGHTSLATIDFGTSYGTFFQSSLMHRRIRDVSITDKGGKITWFSATENLVGTKIHYVTNNETKAVVWMPANENVVLCPDAKTNSIFEYRSFFIPEEESIDTFSINWTQFETPFPAIYQYDKSSWTVVDYSDQEIGDGGGVTALIDGKLDDWWHSQYNNGVAPLPHWAIIDLRTSKNICRIDSYRRPGNTDAKTVQYFVSDNPAPNASTWVKIAEGVFGTGDNLTIDIPDSVSTDKGHYLKIYLPDSNRKNNSSIAEITLYGN